MARLDEWWRAAAVYRDRRVLSLFFFGFSSGLPLALTGTTLVAWLTEVGMALETIGFAALVGISYNLKFLWSPLIDRLPLPYVSRRLGQRRGWMLVSQVLLIGSALGVAGTDPGAADGLRWTVLWAVVIAFASATQDIVIDAYRTEIVRPEQLGAGAAMLTFGYRIAMLASGGGALIVAGLYGWEWAYKAMAVLVLVGVAAVLINPEPKTASALADGTPGRSGAMAWLDQAVAAPFREFMRRADWPIILLFVLMFKSGDALIGHMATTFYLKTGFSLVEVGVVSKGYGLAMTLLGALVGGYLVARLGLLDALLATGILQVLSNLVFIAQAEVGYSVPMLTVTIGVENFSGGMGTTAFVAYLSSLCNLSFTATQYALLSSLFAQSRTLFSAGSGWIVQQVDWIPFFGLTALAGVPGLLLLLYLRRRAHGGPAGASGRLAETEGRRDT